MSTEKIYQKVLEATNKYYSTGPLERHLDIGAGSGRLIFLLNQRFGVISSACDYTDSLMELKGQKIDIVNLNHEALPYPDDSFDFVTATEIIEHLENLRQFLSEIHRVLRPGGICILSTPNILNINSRLRNLWFGFPVLFGPLTIGKRMLHSTAGHINPLSYFYIAHALREIGFSSLDLTFDKYQRSGFVWMLLLFIPLKVMSAFIYRKEIRKYATINSTNAELVKSLNSVPMLLGRTIVVTAEKQVA